MNTILKQCLLGLLLGFPIFFLVNMSFMSGTLIFIYWAAAIVYSATGYIFAKKEYTRLVIYLFLIGMSTFFYLESPHLRFHVTPNLAIIGLVFGEASTYARNRLSLQPKLGLFITSLTLMSIITFVVVPRAVFAASIVTEENTAVIPNQIFLQGIDRNYDINDFKNRVVVIDLWATWCGVCFQKMLQFEALKKRFEGNDKVLFLAVNTSVDDTFEKVKKTIKKTDYNFPMVFDKDYLLREVLTVSPIPRFFIVVDGKVVFHYSTGHKEAQLVFVPKMASIIQQYLDKR